MWDIPQHYLEPAIKIWKFCINICKINSLKFINKKMITPPPYHKQLLWPPPPLWDILGVHIKHQLTYLSKVLLGHQLLCQPWLSVLPSGLIFWWQHWCNQDSLKCRLPLSATHLCIFGILKFLAAYTFLCCCHYSTLTTCAPLISVYSLITKINFLFTLTRDMWIRIRINTRYSPPWLILVWFKSQVILKSCCIHVMPVLSKICTIQALLSL